MSSLIGVITNNSVNLILSIRSNNLCDIINLRLMYYYG